MGAAEDWAGQGVLLPQNAPRPAPHGASHRPSLLWAFEHPLSPGPALWQALQDVRGFTPGRSVRTVSPSFLQVPGPRWRRAQGWPVGRGRTQAGGGSGAAPPGASQRVLNTNLVPHDPQVTLLGLWCRSCPRHVPASQEPRGQVPCHVQEVSLTLPHSPIREGYCPP